MPDPTRKTLSATQTPALFGASPYLTRWMLLRHFIHGDPIDSPEHNRMDWGKRMQPMILQQVAEDLHLGVKINTEDTYVRRGLLGCTRDAEVFCPDRGRGTVEAKCVFDYGVWMETWGGGKTPPRHIEIQTQQQMLVGDGDDEQTYTWGVIAVWVCGEVKYFERKPIETLWHRLNDEALKFFDDVAAKREGSPFGEPVEAPLLAQLFPPVEGKVLDLTTRADAEELTNQVKLMKHHGELANSNEKEKKRIEAQVRAIIGDAETAKLLGGVEVRATRVNKAGHTVKPHSYTLIKPFVPSEQVPLVPQSPEE
jgi:YqaJ-like recombinase protein